MFLLLRPRQEVESRTWSRYREGWCQVFTIRRRNKLFVRWWFCLEWKGWSRNYFVSFPWGRREVWPYGCTSRTHYSNGIPAFHVPYEWFIYQNWTGEAIFTSNRFFDFRIGTRYQGGLLQNQACRQHQTWNWFVNFGEGNQESPCRENERWCGSSCWSRCTATGDRWAIL